MRIFLFSFLILILGKAEAQAYKEISKLSEKPLVITLDEAIDMALEHNQGILVAKDKVRQAKAGITVARSGFPPKISVQGSYTRVAELPSFGMPKYGEIQVPVFGPTGDTIGFTVVPGVVGVEEFEMGEPENYVMRASLQQPLFTWGKALNGYQISKLNLDAVREDLKKEKNELVFNVTKSFYNILTLEQFVKVTEEAYEQIEHHKNTVKKRYKEGLASKSDLLRAKVQLANMEPEVMRAKNRLKIAKTGLKMLLGLPQDTLIELKGKLEVGAQYIVPLQEHIDYAKANRPEIRSLSMMKRISEKSLSIAKRANWPNLIFRANYDYKKPLYYEPGWGKDWNITLALQMPIFTGLENLGKIWQASAQLSQVEHTLNQLKEAIELEVRQAYLQLKESESLIEAQKQNVAQAEEALKIVEERYETGLATSLEVIDTQVALTRAKTNWLQALSDYLISKARLQKAMGKIIRSEQ